MKNFAFLMLSALAVTSTIVPYKANDTKVAPRVVYVDSENGNDNNDGSEGKPVQGLDGALKKSGDLEIHLLGSGKYSSTNAGSSSLFGDGHDNVTIIGEEGKYPTIAIGGVDGNAYIGTNLSLNKVKISNSKPRSRYTLYACGNDLTIGDDCLTDNKEFLKPDGFDTGIEYGLDFQIFAGCNGGSGSQAKKVGDVYVAGPPQTGKLESNGNTLTFLSGDFGKITLSSRVTDTGKNDNHFKPKLVFGGTAYASYIGAANDWFNYIDADITIKDEARVHRIVGGVAGYKYTASVSGKPYIYSGKTTINVEGGYVKNIIGGSMGRMSAYVRQEADTEINVSDGYIESLIGGSAAGNTYGNITVNVSGGTFGDFSKEPATKDIIFGVQGSNTDINHDAGFYCGGAGISSMIHTVWSDPSGNDLKSELFSDRDGCYKENDILDPSKQVMAIGNVYGSIKANITGGTFNCNIHGGGKGFDYSKYILEDAKKNLLFNVAQVAHGVDLTVSGCTVNGNIYGGGAGIPGPDKDDPNYSRIAMVAGTINLHIGNKEAAKNDGKLQTDYSTVIRGTVFGGGVNPKITSQSKVTPAIVLSIENTYIEYAKYATSDNQDEVEEIEGTKRISVHGGSENASVDGPVAIDIKGSYISDDIYLGSGQGSINGSINIDVLDSQIDGNLTLGSINGDINGDVTVLVEGLSVIQDINIGSDKGVINGKVEVTISSTSVSNNVNVGTEDDSFNNDIEVTINKGTTIGGTVNDNTGAADLDLKIEEGTQIEGQMLYVKSFVRAKGNYTNAKLEANLNKMPKDTTVTYQWFKIVGNTSEIVEGATNQCIEHLTSKDVGSYYCVASYTIGNVTENITSNTARFAEKSDVKAAQVGFDSTPYITFYADLSTDYNPSEKATVTIGEETFSVEGTSTEVLGYTTYKFVVRLAPYQMSSDVVLNIESEGLNSKYSVKQYCKEVYDSNNSSAELKNLVKALLNYGAAAQEYFDYAKYNLANSYLNEADKVLSTTSISESYKHQVIDDKSDDIKAYSATIEILTETTMRIYFVEKDGGSFDGYKAYVNGNPLSDSAIKEKDGRHYVEITGIHPQEFNDVYTVKLAKSETEYVSVEYSVLTYCYSKQNSTNESLRDFALSLFDYYMAVQTYQASLAE